MTKTSIDCNVEDDPVQADKMKGMLSLKIFRSKKHRCERPLVSVPADNLQAEVDIRMKKRSRSYIDSPRKAGRCFSGKYASLRLDSFNPSNPLRLRIQRIQDYKICAATWNVGGHSPVDNLNLEKILQIDQSSDIYVLGFQEIVPLSAGNVLVHSDNSLGAKWLDLISRALNKPRNQRINCFHDLPGRSYRVAEDESQNPMSYTLISSKQMVGLFLSLWVRTDLVQSVGHLRVSSLGRGILGRLGNKGCISISMSLHQTRFCFVCCHLASGEKAGDEIRRNSDVAEILNNTLFPKLCKSGSIHETPDKILDHDRVIWLGDLNYRVSMSFDQAKRLIVDGDWDALLQKDQLMIERDAGRVFRGWKEGRILFAPTYKYLDNSDEYARETTWRFNKKNRRTPAWCDRILWYGKGIRQLSYEREESKFSDHRPVHAIFTVETQLKTTSFRNKYDKQHSNIHI